jgi:hypothetical protein
MITATYTFYWYPRTMHNQTDTTVLQKNYTWSMNTKEELDLYAVYKAKDIGAFKHEEYIT